MESTRAGLRRRQTAHLVPALVALMVVGLLSGACSGSDETRRVEPAHRQPSSSGRPAQPEPAIMVRYHEALGDDGVIDAPEALDLFSAAYGDVPGVKRRPVPDDVDGALVSTTPLLSAVSRHFAEYTPEQRLAISHLALGAPDDVLADVSGTAEDLPPGDGTAPETPTGETGSAGHGGGRSIRLLGTEDQEAIRYRNIVLEAIRMYSQRMGIPIRTTVRVRALSIPYPVGTAAASTSSMFYRELVSAGDDLLQGPSTPDNCMIQVGRSIEHHRAEVIRMALYHEAFHCVQNVLMPNHDSLTGPPWLVEGTAAWAATTIAGSGAGAGRWWDRYLEGHDGAWRLFGADYDAIGFFHAVDRSGADLWANMRPTFTTERTDDGYLDVVTQGMEPAAWEAFASGPAQRHDWGSSWETRPPGAGISKARQPMAASPDGAQTFVSVAPGNQMWVVPPSSRAIVLKVDASGFGAFRFDVPGDGAEERFQGTGVSRQWCLADQCVCPDGSPLPGGPYATLQRSLRGKDLVIAEAARNAGDSMVRVSSLRPEDLCEDHPSPVDVGEEPYLKVDGPLPLEVHGGDAANCYQLEDGSWGLLVGTRDHGGSVVATAATGPQTGGDVIWALDAARGGKMFPARVVIELAPDLHSGRFHGDAILTDGERISNAAVSGEFGCGDAYYPPGRTPPVPDWVTAAAGG